MTIAIDHLSSEALVDLQQHLFDDARSGVRPQKLKWKASFKSDLRFSQPARRFCVIIENLFSLRSDTCYPDSAVRLVAV